jgi:AraC-like DNA-binding protein
MVAYAREPDTSAELETDVRPRRPPMLRSKIAPLFLSKLEGRERELARLTTELALPDDAARLDGLSLPLPRFRALAERVAELLGDPLLGLHTAIDLRPGTYGIIEFLLRSAPTPRDALRQLLRFVPLFNSLLRFSLVEEGETAIVEATIDGEPLCLGQHGNEFVLAVFVGLGRQLAGREWAPEHVTFAHPRATNAPELARFFGTSSIAFGRGYLGLRFKTPDLGRRVRTEDEALHAFLEREALARAPAAAADDLELAREAIRASLRSGEPDVTRVARALGVSARTLQRRLAEQGTSFRALVDGVREGLARRYMEDGGRSMKEIAALLGYADARAFGRACKRWTGGAPGALRTGS